MNIKNGMVSVIIPVYNREAYIEECISSVQEQSHQNFEIVLVDDGSTDNTLAICKALAENDARIRIFEGEHKGVSAARNLALDNAEGEYVFFLDSDDVIYPTLIEIFSNGMKEHNAQMAGTRRIGVNEKNWYKVREKISEPPQEGEIDIFDNEQTTDELLLTFNSPFIGVGGVMLRRDLIGNTRFNTDLIIGEDYYFNYQNIIKGAKSIILRQKWYYCRHHATNSIKNEEFSGAFSRILRRVLVSRSEDKLGRTHYSRKQKIEASSLFINYMQKYKINSKDAKNLRNAMKDYKKEIFLDLPFRTKILFFLYLYLPFLAPILLLFPKAKNCLNKLRLNCK